MRKLLMSLAIGAVIASELPAAAQTAEQQRQLDEVLERGKLLFALDRAAWVATDDMLEQIKDARQADLRGYIVDREGPELIAIFYAQEGDRLVAAYRAKVGPRGVASREVFKAGERPELTARQQRLARTLEQLREAAPRLQMCSRSPPNVAIVPPASPDDPIELYVMTPQTESNVLPFGGYHKLTMDRNGRVTGQRHFTNSCIALPLSEPGKPKPAALAISHLLDPIPTEIHVFSAMAAGLPVMVAAGGSVWEVSGDRIRHISKMDSE